mmetsp:Transcript_2346/g.5045  ORF Transcript_2346/g.5045 Transcript_2346/m.5045 type:complete len:93 (-) Transcript_2346:23-301(-)
MNMLKQSIAGKANQLDDSPTDWAHSFLYIYLFRLRFILRDERITKLNAFFASPLQKQSLHVDVDADIDIEQNELTSYECVTRNRDNNCMYAV